LQPSIPVAAFVDPEPGSAAHRALCRAEEGNIDIQFLASYGESEQYFRVQRDGGDRHCVIMWVDYLSGEPVISCSCPAWWKQQEPLYCVHTAAVSKQELDRVKRATQAAPKVASMGRKSRYAG
jgi:hypothetical protein